MPYLPIRGFNHYYEWIPKVRSGNPVMVFMHGWGGSARYWESTAQAMSDRYDCLLYDLRGFGRSVEPVGESTPAYQLEQFADDLAELLDRLNLDTITLNAHSMGTSIAAFFLNTYPERVDRAILTCGGVFDYDPRAFAAFHQFGGYVVKFRPRWLSRIPWADYLFMQRFLHRPLAKSIQQAFLEDFLNADEAIALGTIFECVSERATQVMPEQYAQIQRPALLVSGQYDRIIPAALGIKAAQLSDRIDHVILPQTGHFPMLEDATAYLQAVNQFLDFLPNSESAKALSSDGRIE